MANPPQHERLFRLQVRIRDYLSSVGWRGSSPGAAAGRLDGELHEPRSGGECAYWLSDLYLDFDHVLFRFPACLSYLRKFPLDTARFLELDEDFCRACGGIDSFLHVWHGELRRQNLWDEVVAALEELFQLWTDTFEPDRNAPGSADDSAPWWHVVGPVPAALFLGEIHGKDIPHEQSTLFDHLSRRWINGATTAESSANYLVLLFQIRHSPAYPALAADQRLIQAAADAELCQKHWERAAKVLHAKCPEFYVTALRSSLPIEDS